MSAPNQAIDKSFYTCRSFFYCCTPVHLSKTEEISCAGMMVTTLGHFYEAVVVGCIQETQSATRDGCTCSSTRLHAARVVTAAVFTLAADPNLSHFGS